MTDKMVNLASTLKLHFRHSALWVNFRRMQSFGWRRTLLYRHIVPRILQTRALTTQPVSERPGTPCEVQILTYNGDCMAALWAAKSFYHYAQVDYPLVWHEGGVLSPANRARLKEHFPQSRILSAREADVQVDEVLRKGNFVRCLEARRHGIMMKKMLDCLVLSRAERLLMLDSDVLFFRAPQEIVSGVAAKIEHNLFNRETHGSCYNISPQAAKDRYGIEMVKDLNAGLSLLRRESLTLEMMEEFLHDPDILSNPWLTEQTLQALCASRTSTRFLPDSYFVTGVFRPGLIDNTGRIFTAKHYSGGGRPLLYEEGMRQLIKQGLLDELSPSDDIRSPVRSVHKEIQRG